MPKKIIDTYVSASNYDEAIELASTLPAVDKVPLFHKLASGKHEVAPLRVGLRNTETEKVVGVVGGRYAPVQHEDIVIQALQGLNERGIEVAGMRVGLSDARMHTRIHFKPTDVANAGSGTRKVGDLVSFGILLINSYDGTTPVKGALCAERLVCTNGMTQSAKDLTSVSAKHIESQVVDFADNLDAFLSAVDSEIGDWAERIKSSQNELISLREAERILDASGLTGRLVERIWEQLPEEIAAQGNVLDRWTVYNAATNVLTHTMSANGESPMFNEATLVRTGPAVEALLTAEVPEETALGDKYEPRKYGIGNE